jgi:signal transduction histidine kinase/Tfp pilus assembly protein PilF
MRASTSAQDSGEFDGRYRLTKLLRQGLGVETYAGAKVSSGEPVVIKLTAASAIPPGAQVRLEHEGELLRTLNVLEIAPLLDLGRWQDSLYLVMPFVVGETLAERIARSGPLSVPDALAVGRALMRALQAAHDHGVVHRDLKPSNVILGAGSPPGRVTLVDFGLARSDGLDATLRDQPVGTVAYVSPEQAGLIHCEVGERSDLYSAGILLFESLAGRPPFQGGTVGEILRQHLGARPAELRQLGHPVPRALDGVVHRLLEKDPRDRYQSAAAALADLDEIAAALERGVREPVVAVGTHDPRRRALTEPAFVGRERELCAFESELARAAGGESLLWLVEGESGAGKTRMLDQAAVMARRRGAWILRGQASDRGALRPLQAFDPVVGDILAAARGEPEMAAALRTRLGEHLEILCAAMPQLFGLLGPGMLVSLGPEAHGEARILPALIALLDALGSPARPAVILLDDCQWLDELSLKLLSSWHRAHRHRSGAGGVLLVAAYRGDEVPGDSLLRHLDPAARIALGPLADDEVGRMAESMAGALPSEAVALVARLSEGNPFLAVAVLEGLVERGALLDAPQGWELEPRMMAEAQSSRRAAAFLAQRLDKLPRPALELLSAGAILGRSFEVRLAADLAGQPPAEAMASLGDARRRHLVWMEPQGDRYTFVHEKLRETVLGRLTPAARRRLHGVAALALSASESGPDREFDLAYHFDAAGEHARALPHALSAATQARAQCALETAERFYRIAERGAADESAGMATRRRVAEGLGDVLLMRGRYDEAGAALARARALAESAVQRAAIEGKLGELAFKRGDVRAASEALERALRLLGRRAPARPAMLVATMWQALVQVVHTLLPRRLVARRRLEDGEADLLAARVLSRLAYANWFLRGQLATFWAHLTELNLAERYPPTRELAQACSEHAISVTGLPRFLFSRGVRYAERGLAIRRALGDVWGQGQSLNFYGILLYAFAHYAEAREKFLEALRVLRHTGDRWEANVAGFHIAFCHQRLGALREAVEECRRVHREAVEIGDGHAMSGILEVWAKATGGAIPAALVDAAMQSSEGDPQTRETVLQAEGMRRIGAGHPREAADAFAAAEEVARSAKLENEYVSHIPIWIAYARRLCAAQAAVEAGVLLPAMLDEAAAALRRGLRRARRYRGNLPMALRERALLRAMRGHFQKARRDLDASLAEAERQGARFEAAQTLRARGDLGCLLGWPGAQAEVARGRALLHEMGADFACAPLHALARDKGLAPAEVHGAATAELDASLRRLQEVQDQLVQTAKIATADTLVAGLSHEINGPVGVILVHAVSSLRQMDANHPLWPAMTAIERQARRCAALVSTFLEVARGSSSREDIALDDLVRHVVELASSKARQRDTAVEVSLPPDSCLVRVSRTQIESALMNVVDNAIDASPRGGAVRIEAVLCERERRRGVEVRVCDRGTGIDPAVLSRVFDPFFTTKTAGLGTGLGLPLARQFVEEHEGRLSIESRRGEGTTVRLWLPISTS